MPDPSAPVSLFSILLLGISMGLTACTVTCLPFMGTWALGRADNTEEAFRHTLWFIAGRVLAYTVLGALAAWLGKALLYIVDGGLGNMAIGTAAILAGTWLLLPERPHASCAAARQGQTLPPFLLGMGLSLTPCVPLATLLTLCALSGQWLDGAAQGLAFGLGAAVTPILILVPLCARFGVSLRDDRPWLTLWLRAGAALVLVGLGLRRLVSTDEMTPALAASIGLLCLAAYVLVRWSRRAPVIASSSAPAAAGYAKRIPVVMTE